MCATAANLIERVLPEVALRQWVLTFPFAWHRGLGHLRTHEVGEVLERAVRRMARYLRRRGKLAADDDPDDDDAEGEQRLAA